MTILTTVRKLNNLDTAQHAYFIYNKDWSSTWRYAKYSWNGTLGTYYKTRSEFRSESKLAVQLPTNPTYVALVNVMPHTNFTNSPTRNK